MPSLILGTAGHIDHGKTALVHALTGIDTDRLCEEKERGITIDLGFAELSDGVRHMGVVDVPGHEGFIRNMVAGATGMDVVLLVIAADEGVMPQTREHLDIVTLLGVERLVVALTKADLVDEEWLEMVREEVQGLLAGGPYEGAPILPTSVRTGVGVEALARTLLATAEQGSERDSTDPARLPVDRVFTVHGTGTVVTGTLRSGRLRIGDRVRVIPGELVARVRGLQVHGREVEEARVGERTAVALAGAGTDRQTLTRGQAVISGPGWAPASMLTARLRVLPGAGWRIERGQRVRVHLGTAEVMARCAVLEAEALEPGDEGWVQLRLEEPVPARARDAFVVRSFSPVTTIGGGRVAELHPPRRGSLGAEDARRLVLMLEGAPATAVGAALELAGPGGVAREALPVLTGLTPGEVASALGEPPAGGGAAPYACGDLLLAGGYAERARGALLAAVEAQHRNEPLRPGIAAEALRATLSYGSPPALADRLLEELVASGVLEVRSGIVSRRGFSPLLSPEQERAQGALRDLYREAGLAPPSVEELPEPLRGRTDLWPLLRLLESESALTSLDHGLFVWREELDRAARAVTRQLGGRKGLGPADFREILPVTRKHLLPLLAYFDWTGVTVRRESGREVPEPAGTGNAGRTETRESEA